MNINLVGHIEERIGSRFFVKKVRTEGCEASMSGITLNRAILSLDLYDNGDFRGRCDFVVFFQDEDDDRMFCILIELKRGKLSARQVLSQLQGTARQLDELLDRLGIRKFFVDFVPVAITGSANRIEERLLARRDHEVKFGNSGYAVRLQRCRTPDNLLRALGKRGSR